MSGGTERLLHGSANRGRLTTRFLIAMFLVEKGGVELLTFDT